MVTDMVHRMLRVSDVNGHGWDVLVWGTLPEVEAIRDRLLAQIASGEVTTTFTVHRGPNDIKTLTMELPAVTCELVPTYLVRITGTVTDDGDRLTMQADDTSTA